MLLIIRTAKTRLENNAFFIGWLLIYTVIHDDDDFEAFHNLVSGHHLQKGTRFKSSYLCPNQIYISGISNTSCEMHSHLLCWSKKCSQTHEWRRKASWDSCSPSWSQSSQYPEHPRYHQISCSSEGHQNHPAPVNNTTLSYLTYKTKITQRNFKTLKSDPRCSWTQHHLHQRTPSGWSPGCPTSQICCR